MKKIANHTTDIQQETPLYLPVRLFYEKMSSRKSPYQCQFSFEPFFEKIRLRLEDVSDELSKKIGLLMSEIEQEVELLTDEIHLDQCPEKLERLVHFLFPNIFVKERLGFIKVPFSQAFAYVTPSMLQLMENDEWEIKIPDFYGKDSNSNIDIAHLVLNFFYDINLELVTREVLTFRNKKTGLLKFYKINIIQDFIQGKALKPLKKLDEELLFQLVEHFDNADLWEEHLPPENFIFKGFVIGYMSEVTEAKVTEKVKEIMLSEGEDRNHNEDLHQLQNMTRSFMDMPNLELGMLHTVETVWQKNTSWSLLRKFDEKIMCPSFENKKGSYGKVLEEKKVVIVTDLTRQKHRSRLENELMKKGVKSLLLAPLFNKDKEQIGIFELADPKPYAFNRLSYLKLREVIELFATGTNKFIEALEHQERLTMQQEFTSIHSSVEWRFREVAAKLFWERSIEGQRAKIEQIIFKDLYPLYAQADIVGSSKLRNESIQTDLEDNLTRAIEIMKMYYEKVNFHLLVIYLSKAKGCLNHLKQGLFISSDETRITELIKQEIHPLLKELRDRFPELLREKVAKYFAYIDPQLDIVYRRRRNYDESVSQLNNMIGNFLEQEDAKMQKILPHHFEKFTTDGVEYNIYLGNSLLKKGGFSLFFLKDFRLWQLINMCEITRIVANEGSQLPTPLQTAQLIFVYNNSLSIRFKMEEKQFDVDGTYNVRYEILKKRIDKAVVKGTKERLTLAGKIAIVWLQEKDRVEYFQYLEHLKNEGYIDGEIEDLELEKLQGVHGLKALRFKVKI